MHIVDPVTITQLYIDNDSKRNKYTGLINANFQDYMDSLKQGGQFQFQSQRLKQRISSVTTGLGMAAGAFGGPAGMAVGFSIGNSMGKYIGNVMGDRIYGQAIADMAEISFQAKTRHGQLAASLAFTNQIDGAIDTLRQNENKRRKDDLQAMQT